MIDSINNFLFAGSEQGFSYATILFLLLTLRAIVNLEKSSEVIKFFKNPKTIGNLILIMIWCYLVYRFSKNKKASTKNIERVQNATKKALLALLIAFFARIELVIAPFWLIWVIAYYLEDWV